jgi:hypothetical protein
MPTTGSYAGKGNMCKDSQKGFVVKSNCDGDS